MLSSVHPACSHGAVQRIGSTDAGRWRLVLSNCITKHVNRSYLMLADYLIVVTRHVSQRRGLDAALRILGKDLLIPLPIFPPLSCLLTDPDFTLVALGRFLHPPRGAHELLWEL